MLVQTGLAESREWKAVADHSNGGGGGRENKLVCHDLSLAIACWWVAGVHMGSSLKVL